ncbi:MAG TPA: cytochrome-c peroxidase [Polyangiales bacterium]|nr:cytochrome-c peroxidase [Polyangiales bacterium]
MLQARTWSGVACLGLLVACSGGESASTPTFEPPPPAAMPNGEAPAAAPAAQTPNSSPVAPPTAANTKPADMSPAQAQPDDKPFPGLPVGPGLPVDQVNPNFKGLVKVIPTDQRIVKRAATPPISGGTLAIGPNDKLAVAADPDRDRVSIVDLTTNKLTATIALQPGDEPGRVVFDNAGRVHVALRRGGAVVSIDTTTKAVVERRAVCAAPRGIHYDAAAQQLIVACQSGELVSLPKSGAGPITRSPGQSDLRDIAFTTKGMFVSRLKSAELLAMDAKGAMLASARPAFEPQFFAEPDGSQVADTLSAVGARRLISSRDGGMIMLHQSARDGDIELKQSEVNGAMGGPGASPYGGAGGCSSVVGNAITRFNADGKVVMTAQFGAALPVDVAESMNGELAVAVAGAFDPAQPTVAFTTPDAAFAGGGAAGAGIVPPDVQPDSVPVDAQLAAVFRFFVSEGVQKVPGQPRCVDATNIMPLRSPATAVAYLSDGRLAAQTREPAGLYVTTSAFDQGALPTFIDLGGASVLDTGHEIFHRDAGGGVACASCHLEGGDDGHVWRFTDQGPRRTQSMFVGLEGTAPFHWVGDMNDLGKLMEQVFVGRMGGVHQSKERLVALEQWMYSVKAMPALRAADDAAAVRGNALFHGEAECGKCHNGPKLTNNETVDVGTGLALQVPSLISIGYRAPWIHNGCAKTLQQRFDPSCGGASHGKTAQLTPAQIDDVVAYLETL